MYKDDFVAYLSKKYRRSQRHYQDAITEILAGLQDQLKQGKEVRLLGFGTFSTRMRRPAKALDFKTNKPIAVPALRLVAFRPGNRLKQAVRRQAPPAQKKARANILKRFLPSQ